MNRIAMFQAHLEKKPADRFALYGLALELKKAGRGAEAERAFEVLLAAHPTSGAGHLQLGELYRAEGRRDQAIAAWRRGLEALAGLDDPDARRSRGELEAAIDEVDDQPG